MKGGHTPIHIQRWAPADYHDDEHVKLLESRRAYMVLHFYRQFLDHSFMAGGDLPANPDDLAVVVRMRPGEVRTALAFCLGRLIVKDGDRLYQRRVKREVRAELRYRKEQSKRGREGGLVAGKGRPKGGRRGGDGGAAGVRTGGGGGADEGRRGGGGGATVGRTRGDGGQEGGSGSERHISKGGPQATVRPPPLQSIGPPSPPSAPAPPSTPAPPSAPPPAGRSDAEDDARRLGSPGEAEQVRAEIRVAKAEASRVTGRPEGELVAEASRTPNRHAFHDEADCSSVPWLRKTLEKLITIRFQAQADQRDRPPPPPTDRASAREAAALAGIEGGKTPTTSTILEGLRRDRPRLGRGNGAPGSEPPGHRQDAGDEGASGRDAPGGDGPPGGSAVGPRRPGGSS